MGAGIDTQGRALENAQLRETAHGSQLTERRWKEGFSLSFLVYLHAIPRHHVYNEKTRIKHTVYVSLMGMCGSIPQPRVLRAAISEALPCHGP